MKRFDLITEADARLLEAGSTVELTPGGHVTPLARDTLRDRRVTVIEAGSAGDDGEALVPRTPVRRVAVGSDHAGVALRRAIVAHLRAQGREAVELGPEREGEKVDYPEVAAQVSAAVVRDEADAGIVIDAAGIGSAIAANKVPGIRAAMCQDETLARHAREHNGANVLALGARLLSVERALAVVDAWLRTSMREPRYIRRLAAIRRLEARPPR